MMHCPPREQLHRLLTDQLTEADEQALDTHLSGCPACVRTLEGLTAPDGAHDPRRLGSILPYLKDPSWSAYGPTADGPAPAEQEPSPSS